MNKNIFLLAGLAIAIAFTGCTKDFEDLNTNPNEPASVSPGFLLTASQKRIMDEMNDSFWGSRRGMQLSQYWSSNQYSNESRYQFRTEVSNGSWRDFYAGPLQDLQAIIDQNTDSPDDVSGYGSNGNQIAVAKILQAWTYQMLTDAWGPIPMTEALQGVDNTTPAYDSQEAVYDGIMGLINDAMSSMDDGAGPQGDQIYGGNMMMWEKFANSLKLRVAMRMSDVAPDAAKTAGEEHAAAIAKLTQQLAAANEAAASASQQQQTGSLVMMANGSHQSQSVRMASGTATTMPKRRPVIASCMQLLAG